MKSRSPYRVKALTLNRFRGLVDGDGRHNIDDAYVGNIINLTSQKIGELNNRDGQYEDDHYTSGVTASGRLVTSKFVVSGTDVYGRSTIRNSVKSVDAYDAPADWSYPWPESELATTDLTELMPVPTCSDLWSANDAMSQYEEAGEADTDITNGTSPCWTVTCADMWALFPDYVDYQDANYEDSETQVSGGTAPISKCWSQTLNCKALYKLYPEWDEYRTDEQAFPDCWDFEMNAEAMTCASAWDELGTPEDLRKSGGVYPDCIVKKGPTLGDIGVKLRLDNFTATPSRLDITLDGTETTSTPVATVELEAVGFYEKELSDNYSSIAGDHLNFELVSVSESFGMETVESMIFPTRRTKMTYDVYLTKEALS